MVVRLRDTDFVDFAKKKELADARISNLYLKAILM